MIKLRFFWFKKIFFRSLKKVSPFLDENVKKTKNYQVVNKSKKVKILIAAHCFFDSPIFMENVFFRLL